jgi:hypothetical protein
MQLSYPSKDGDEDRSNGPRQVIEAKLVWMRFVITHKTSWVAALFWRYPFF